MMKISIIIPSYNSRKTIWHTLKSLSMQTRPDLIEEIIVVDSSDDVATVKLLKEAAGKGEIKLIKPACKTMPAIARNIGAGHAAADYLAFLDSDVMAAGDWVEKIMMFFDKGYRAGGGSVSAPFFQQSSRIALAQLFLQFNEFLNFGVMRKKFFCPSCNLFCEKKLFDLVGGFPAIRASEDVLFGLELTKHCALWFVPEVAVFHIFREEKSGFLNNQRLLGRYINIWRSRAESRRFYYKRLWAIVFMPALFAVKFARILSRIVRTDIPTLCRFCYSMPFFLLGLFFWSLGFAKGGFDDEV